MTPHTPGPKHHGLARMPSVLPSLTAALALSGLLLAGCGGGGGGDASSKPTEAPPGPNAGLSASQPGELLSYVQSRLRSRGAQGSQDIYTGVLTDAAVSTAGSLASSPSAQARSAPLSAEAGVDEADLLQSDGTRLFTLQPAGAAGLSVQVYSRAEDGRALPQAQLKLAAQAPATGIASDGMHYSSAGQALAVVSRSWLPVSINPDCREVCTTIAPNWLRNSVGVHRIDVANSSAPRVSDEISIEGQLVDSRRIGDRLVLVLSHRPTLAPDMLPASATAAEREAAITRLSVSEVLPKLRRGGGAAQPLVAETDCYVPKQNGSPVVEITTVSVIDLKAATMAPRSSCIVGGSEALYMSASSLYVASTQTGYTIQRGSVGSSLLIYPAEIKTEIHKFGLADHGVVYRGSGEVQGHLGWDTQKKSLRMSEHQGDLRVLTYTGQTGWVGEVADSTRLGTPSPARLTVLREGVSTNGIGSLVAVATLPNTARPAAIGKAGEQVYGVRFVGDRGYVVTFRRTDPLYVLDLSNATDPKTVGELEVPGYAEYLFPLPQGLLLGVGRDADERGTVTGLKVSLLDVADPTKPRQLSSQRLGGSFSMSALDSSRMGLNLLDVGGVVRAALPVALAEGTGGVFPTSWRNGLQRFEIDTRERTLRTLSLIPGKAGTPYESVPYERSLQIGNQVHYLSMDTLITANW